LRRSCRAALVPCVELGNSIERDLKAHCACLVQIRAARLEVLREIRSFPMRLPRIVRN
jgi:hypothetical protein